MDRELGKLRNRLTEDYNLSSLWITDKIARKGWFLIDLIAVEPEAQGQGFGGKAMRELLAFADRRGLKVALTPDALYGSSKTRLTKWYASLGFVPNTEPDVPEEMIRYPQLEPARISAYYRFNPDTRLMRRRICGDCGLTAFPGHHCSYEPYKFSRPDAVARRVKTERLKKRELVGATSNFWRFRRNPTRAETILEGRGCLGGEEALQAAKSVRQSLNMLKRDKTIRGSTERGIRRLLKNATQPAKTQRSGRSYPSPEERFDWIQQAREMMRPFYLRGLGSRVIKFPAQADRDIKDPRLGHIFGAEYSSVAARYNPTEDYFWRRNPQKEYVGNCVDSFDEEGDCIMSCLPYRDASDFACNEEDAVEISEEQFRKEAFVPEGLATRTGNKVYLVDDQGVYMLYDVDADIHYFFV